MVIPVLALLALHAVGLHLRDVGALLGQDDRACNARDADAYHARAMLAHGLHELHRHRPSEARNTTMWALRPSLVSREAAVGTNSSPPCGRVQRPQLGHPHAQMRSYRHRHPNAHCSTRSLSSHTDSSVRDDGDLVGARGSRRRCDLIGTWARPNGGQHARAGLLLLDGAEAATVGVLGAQMPPEKLFQASDRPPEKPFETSSEALRGR